MTESSRDLESLADGSSIIGRISRRRLIQGGVATGVALSVPLLPMPAVATESEMDLVAEPLDLATAVATVDPRAQAASAPGALATLSAASSGAGHLRFPVIETGEFCSLAVRWDGPVADARVRVRRGGAWSEWMDLHIDPDEAPDPGEAPDTGRRLSRPLWTGRADAAELSVPDGVTEVRLDRVVETDRRVVTTGSPMADAAPGILPRSAWAAKPYNGTPVYSPLKLAIVHHSVNSNNYTPEQVPALLRSMQAHHQGTNGWSDIAYNFLVDKWGRIWEGRDGGVDRPVIGGHTYGCNTGTVGICYIGDLRSIAMPAAAVNAITSLIKWKFFQVHAVSPYPQTWFAPATTSTNGIPAGELRLHPTVVGHRHLGSTECPASAMPGVVSSIHAAVTNVQDVRGLATVPGGNLRVTASGQAMPYGLAAFYGSMEGAHLNSPMVTLAPTASGKGYWMLAADGGIFSFGDAAFHGSTGGMRLNRPVVGMAATKSGKGYWLVAADGGIFSFGDATFHGSMGGSHLNRPVIGMARTASGNGYWLFASDGGIFTFGDAGFFGSGGGSPLPAPAVDVSAHPNGLGYWLALANGTVRAFGTAPHHGSASVPSSDPIVGISATLDGGGYWLAARSGKVFSFGNAT